LRIINKDIGTNDQKVGESGERIRLNQ